VRHGDARGALGIQGGAEKRGRLFRRHAVASALRVHEQRLEGGGAAQFALEFAGAGGENLRDPLQIVFREQRFPLARVRAAREVRVGAIVTGGGDPAEFLVERRPIRHAPKRLEI